MLKSKQLDNAVQITKGKMVLLSNTYPYQVDR